MCLLAVTEYEIKEGMFDKKDFDTDRNVLVIYRTITNLDEHKDKEEAAFFLDFKPESREIDEDARAWLKQLKETRIPAAMKKSEICKLDVEWRDFSKRPSDNEEYLGRVCDGFLTSMQKLIDQSAMKVKANKLNTEPYVVEVLQHMTMCKSR